MHETPAYHIAHLFVTSRVKGSLVAGAKSVPQFVGEFTGAIEQGESLGAYIKPDYDWQAARKRVEDLLAQHGETLDGVKAYAEGKKKQ